MFDKFIRRIEKTQVLIIMCIVALMVFVFVDTLIRLPENLKKANNMESSLSQALASWWLAKAYFSEAKPPDIVMLGSSQLSALYCADAQVFDRAIDITDDHRCYTIEQDLKALLNKQLRVFLAALPVSMISDQLVIAHALFSKEYKPKLVAVTFSPSNFVNSDVSSDSQSEAFAFFSSYHNPNLLRSDLNKILAEECKSKKNGANISCAGDSALHLGRPFQYISPTDIIIYSDDDYSFKDDTEIYRRKYKKPFSLQFKKQLKCLDTLFKYLKQLDIKVIAFNFPISAANKKILPDNFWKYYDPQISKICSLNDVDYINADRVVLPFNDNEFADGIHLNLNGGHRWSKPVAFYIANRFRLKTFKALLAMADKSLL